jgi:5-formyltetrahydrofolate cyclo-ligase
VSPPTLPGQQLNDAAAAVFNVLRQQKFYRDARSVGCYLSMKKGELRTARLSTTCCCSACGLRRHANANGSEQGAVHALPAPAASQADQDTPLMEMLRLYSPADFRRLPAG